MTKSQKDEAKFLDTRIDDETASLLKSGISPFSPQLCCTTQTTSVRPLSGSIKFRSSCGL